MDTDTLVEEAIDGGEALLEKLRTENFPIETAFWLKNSEDGAWYFYIASPTVDNDGPASAYQTLYQVMQSLTSTAFWVMRTDVKLIGTQDPTAKAVFNIYQSYPGKGPIRYRGRQLGSVFIDEAYLYPLPA